MRITKTLLLVFITTISFSAQLQCMKAPVFSEDTILEILDEQFLAECAESWFPDLNSVGRYNDPHSLEYCP